MRIAVNQSNVDDIIESANLALWDTAEAIRTDLLQSQTIPFDIGTLQDNTFTRPKSNKQKVRLVSNTPYARKLYFHPEYNFKKINNPNASGRWFDPYINGKKKTLMRRYFEMNLRRRLGI